MGNTLSRRVFLRTLSLGSFALLVLAGCKRHFVRPGKTHDIGEVRYALFDQQHVRDESLLVYRDDKGWRALSTRCSYDGCDLTFQNTTLLCSCCKSVFTQLGQPTKGPAEYALPWYAMSYKSNHLYVNSGKVVGRDYRFTTPEIEKEIKEIREKIKQDGVGPNSQIPNVLLGHGGKKGR